MTNTIKTALLAVAGAFLCAGGCATSGPRGGGPDALPPIDLGSRNTSGISGDEIQQARQIYAVKCARCHNFYDPSKYDSAEWNTWMIKMSRKAHLDGDQEKLLRRYLGVFRSGEQ